MGRILFLIRFVFFFKDNSCSHMIVVSIEYSPSIEKILNDNLL